MHGLVFRLVFGTEEYDTGDNIGSLDCGHDFHTDCIKQWLAQKNICPICKMPGLAP
ncbi:putative transcription factor C2H2 family [Helianthus annuus]|nr:putative transcription factor C2H2 family [Helianthus annuus]KAJ0644187.1 putative transcription factor C2H2 family [Helianthus annuus]